MNVTVCVDMFPLQPVFIESYLPTTSGTGHWGLHYGSGDPTRFQGVEGYEGYAAQFAAVAGSAGGYESASGFGKPQLIGTPDQIIEQVHRIQRLTSVKEIVVGAWGFGGMPFDVGEKSFRLFAKEVLPVIQAMPAPLHPPVTYRHLQTEHAGRVGP
jgi:hypothetical protein